MNKPLRSFLALAALLAVAGAQGQPPSRAGVVPPLLADDGSAYPAAAGLPAAEAVAGGPAPGWASAAQREQLQRVHPRRVLRLHAAGDGSALPRPLPPPQAWVFVDGPAVPAVRLARRLAAAGVESVWVMLPPAAQAHASLAGQQVRP